MKRRSAECVSGRGLRRLLGTALDAGVAFEVVVGGRTGAELVVRLVAISSDRVVRGSMGHAATPFQNVDRTGIMGGVET